MKKEDLLKKWLTQRLNAEEKKEFEKLEDYDLNEEIIEGARFFKASSFSRPNSYESFKTSVDSRKNAPKVFKLNSLQLLLRVAAIFLISVGVYFTFYNNQETTLDAPIGTQVSLSLPDQSSVILNAGSHVSFNEKKWATKRTVKLQGEAFFKVTKGSKFDVKTEQGTVSVLGTEFSVKQRYNYFEVICYEGLVQVMSKNEVHKLSSGKSFRILKDVSSTYNVSDSKPNWLDNISKFNSVPLYVVLNELERQYEVSINVVNLDTDKIFTGAFKHDNLEEALKAITLPLELKYKKESKNNITLFPKDK